MGTGKRAQEAQVGPGAEVKAPEELEIIASMGQKIVDAAAALSDLREMARQRLATVQRQQKRAQFDGSMPC